MQYKQGLLLKMILVGILVFLTIAACTNKLDLPEYFKQKAIKPGGQIVYGSLQEPNTLNPLLSDLLATSEVCSLIFSGLLYATDKGEWAADLAEEVPTIQNGGVSADGLTVTYKLKQGVSWHDGVPFTADDVKFTWQIIMDKKVNIVFREGYDKIAAIDIPDNYTVIVRYKEYYAPYLTLFPTILPKHILENSNINNAAYNRAPIGTGAFKFKEWHMSDNIILEANPNYFQGKPNLDRIIYKIIPDTNLMFELINNGTLDIVSNISFSQLEQLKAITGIRLVITPNMIWERLDFNLDNSLFLDPFVRKAINLALNRQEIITDVLKGSGSLAIGDQPPLSWAYNPAAKLPVYDVKAAKELLTQAGWSLSANGIFEKNGKTLSFTLAYPTGTAIRDEVAENIAKQLGNVGIAVKLCPINNTLFFNNVLKNRQFETAMYAFVSGLDPDNLNLWHSKKIPSRANGYEGQNYAGWRNAEVDALTEQGTKEINIEARKQIYLQIQELISNEDPIIPLYFRVNIDAVRKNIVNYRPNPTPSGNLWNAWQWGLSNK